ENGSIVAVFGGFVNRSSTSDPSLYFLDTKTWRWRVVTSNSVRGRSYSACAFSGNQFIVWGGFYQNPTSTPNNLPSVEESTLVYSFDAQNWVSTFVPSGSSGSGGGSSQGDRGNNSDLLNPNAPKSVGVILVIAIVGVILVLLIITGVIILVRKRNKDRGNSSNARSPGDSLNSGSALSNKTLGNSWDQKTLADLENNFVNSGANTIPGKADLRRASLSGADEMPPIPGYNSWEHRGSIASQRSNRVETTTTTISPMAGITQTTIVTTPKSSSKSSKVGNPTSRKTTTFVSNGRRISEQCAERPLARNQPSFAPTPEENETQDSWINGYQTNQMQSSLEQKFEEKSNGVYYPISVNRTYF
ncbi:hypothetical protein BX616_005140, partial [Lobosporangium transversale]